MRTQGGIVRSAGLRAAVLLVGVCLILGQVACTTTRVLTVSGSAPAELRPGQTVTLHLADGTAPEVEIRGLGETGLTTQEGRRIAWTQIERIEQRKVSAARTAGAVTAVVVVAMVAVAAAFAHAMEGAFDNDR